MIIVNNLIEIVLPYLTNLFFKSKANKEREEERLLDHEHGEEDEIVTQAEKEFEHTTYENTISDFEELGIFV
jgi:hypothetical protein